MSELIISVSGLRGIVGEAFTPEVAVRYVRAFAVGLPEGPILMTRDGRASGPMLAAAIRQGLTEAGREVIDGDVAATPTTGVLVRHLGAAGGIQISASHNPAEYNGIKLFGGDGRVISANAGQAVIDRYENQTETSRTDASTTSADARVCEDTVTAHWQLIEPVLDMQRIRSRSFKVLLDANHGSGSLLGRYLLEQLGCDATVSGGLPDGLFEHLPEPTAENLRKTAGLVRELGADIGFCQDPDADRLAIIDETGRYIGEEYTLALCVNHLLRQQKGPVVTNCSTSRMSQDIAERYGVPFFHAAVGEANVTAKMIEVGAVIGGEGNGGVIDPRVGYVRDSFVGMALILDAMASREMTISQLSDELPRYSIVKTKYPLAREQLAAATDALKGHFADADVNEMDGLRFDWPGPWLLVRASNTEPIIRIMAEATTSEEADALCREAACAIGVQ